MANELEKTILPVPTAAQILARFVGLDPTVQEDHRGNIGALKSDTESVLALLAGADLALKTVTMNNPAQALNQKMFLWGAAGKEIVRMVSPSFVADEDAFSYIAAVESALGLSIPSRAFEAIHAFFAVEKAAGRWVSVKKMALPIWNDALANFLDLKGGPSFSTAGAVVHAHGYIQGDGSTAHFGGINSIGDYGMSRTSAHVMALVYAEDTRAGSHAYFGVSENTSADGTSALYVDDSANYAYHGQVNGVGATGVALAGSDSRGVVGLNSNTSHLELLRVRDGVVAAASAEHNPAYWVSTGVAPIFMGVHQNYGTVNARTNAKFGMMSMGLGLSDADARGLATSMETLWKNTTGLTY